jgi:hypothetical protein
MIGRLLALLVVVFGGGAQAQTVALEEGVAAWERVFDVLSHPRCSNCHVGPRGVPMWEGLSFGKGKAHGMGVIADESRIGAESIPCRTCHVTAAGRDLASPAPPQIDDAWRLPPVEHGWRGKDKLALCMQFRDPELNDGQEIADIVEHLESSAFVAWGFAPGRGRLAPQGSVAQLVSELKAWEAAGTPCK